MNIKYIVSFILTVFVVAGIWFFVATKDLNEKKEAVIKTPKPLSSEIVHIKGNKDAAITLVEYSDLQCPACGVYYPLVKQLMKDFGDKISFEYRHFPLRTTHQNAELASLATEAAGLQGKFWEMHDVLFEKQKEWAGKSGEDIFDGYAKDMGLNVLKFKSDLSFNKDLKDKVESDYQNGLKQGVNSTPSFFLNGARMENPRSYGEFRNVVQQFILTQ